MASAARACRPTSAPGLRRVDGPHALRAALARQPPPPLPPLPSSEEQLPREARVIAAALQDPSRPKPGSAALLAKPLAPESALEPSRPLSPCRPLSPEAAAPLPPEAVPVVLGGPLESVGEEQEYDEDEDADFSEEELALEREVEGSLKALEAADASALALQVQLENATESVAYIWRELSQLQGVVSSWESAAEEGRLELAERKQRVDEFFATLPEGAASECKGAGTQRDPADTRRLDLAMQRTHVLEGQLSRLESQVSEQHKLAKARMDERARLEQQVASHERERDNLRNAVQEARDRRRAMEGQLKGREDAIEAQQRRRQALDRQAVKLRGEANGIRARLASIAPSPAANGGTGGDDVNADKQAGPPWATLPAAAEQAAQDAEDTDAVPGESARAASLRLQKQVVELWEELRRCDAEAQALQAKADKAKAHASPEAPMTSPATPTRVPPKPDTRVVPAASVSARAAGAGVAARRVAAPVVAG